jgi:hypothetical protein
MVEFPGSFVSLLNLTRLQSGPSHELSKVFGSCKLFVQCLFVEREDRCGECRCFTHTPCCPSMLMFIGFPMLCKINVVIISEVESYESMEIVDVAARPLQGNQSSNSSDDELVRLCRAWLNANQNSTKGVGQKSDHLWGFSDPAPSKKPRSEI